jgi:uncharacterized protein (DUF362 family)
MPFVSKIKVEDNLKQAIVKAVEEIGGFKNFIKIGDVVLLKPNFNTADPYPASTDLNFLKAAVELIYEAGAKLVIIGESCTMTMNTRKVMEKLGVFELEKMEPAPRIMVFEEKNWIKKEIPGAQFLKNVSVPEILDKVDKVIFLPCLKTHFQARYTGALKLSVAFMKPSQRVAMHLRNIQEKIAELNSLVRCDLVIMDARKCFINKGPSHGEIREPGLILASTGRPAIDVEGVKIIQGFEGNSLKGIIPEDLPQIKLARELGIDRSGPAVY